MAFCGAWLYLRYAIPVYQSKCTVLIKGQEESGAISEEKLIGQLGVLGGNSNLENEIQILKSKSMMREVVEELQLPINFFVKGKVISSDLYRRSPFTLDSFQLNEKALGKVY